MTLDDVDAVMQLTGAVFDDLDARMGRPLESGAPMTPYLPSGADL